MSDTPNQQQSGTGAIEAAAAAITGNPTPPADQQAASQDQGNPDPDVDLSALGDAGKQALDRMKAERNEAKRQAAELKAKLDKIEAANMSDLERAQKEAADAREAAARAAAEALRFRVATRHGISDEDAELFLIGSDEDTLTRQALRLSERTPTTPRPDPSQGAQHAEPLNGDGLTNALARAVGARSRT